MFISVFIEILLVIYFALLGQAVIQIKNRCFSSAYNKNCDILLSLDDKQ